MGHLIPSPEVWQRYMYNCIIGIMSDRHGTWKVRITRAHSKSQSQDIFRVYFRIFHKGVKIDYLQQKGGAFYGFFAPLPRNLVDSEKFVVPLVWVLYFGLLGPQISRGWQIPPPPERRFFVAKKS